MRFNFFNNTDFWAGMMFIGIGAGAMIIARDYQFGSTLRMGPGYFPSVLGGLLILFGIYVMATGVRKSEKISADWSPRALVMLPLALVLFGVLMAHTGFIPALVALIFGSAAAGREFKLGEVFLLTAFLIVLATTVFIWALGLPFSLIKGF